MRQLDASSIVKAVVDALDQGGDVDSNGSSVSLVTDYITHTFYPIGTEIEIDEQNNWWRNCGSNVIRIELIRQRCIDWTTLQYKVEG